MKAVLCLWIVGYVRISGIEVLAACPGGSNVGIGTSCDSTRYCGLDLLNRLIIAVRERGEDVLKSGIVRVRYISVREERRKDENEHNEGCGSLTPSCYSDSGVRDISRGRWEVRLGKTNHEESVVHLRDALDGPPIYWVPPAVLLPWFHHRAKTEEAAHIPLERGGVAVAGCCFCGCWGCR
jgi:hypothetical protein